MSRTGRYEPRRETPKPKAAGQHGIDVTWAVQASGAVPGHEATRRALELARELERVARLRERIEIRLISGSDNVSPEEGDIGLQDGLIIRDGTPAVNVLFSDGTYLSRQIAIAVPWTELAERLARLLRAYMVEGCAKDTFTSWTRAMSVGELRERLGFRAPDLNRHATP